MNIRSSISFYNSDAVESAYAHIHTQTRGIHTIFQLQCRERHIEKKNCSQKKKNMAIDVCRIECVSDWLNQIKSGR